MLFKGRLPMFILNIFFIIHLYSIKSKYCLFVLSLHKCISNMIKALIPIDEKKRLQALEKYDLLDTMPEDNYDSITDIISIICDVPIALITLVDKERTFLKSRMGLEDMVEAPRELSFCSHTIVTEEEIFIVPDAQKDVRFQGNPILDKIDIAFYAGVPLIDKNGYKLGALCVSDYKPRKLNETQMRALKNMAKHVMILFEERYQNMQLQRMQKELKERNDELKDFAGSFHTI